MEINKGRVKEIKIIKMGTWRKYALMAGYPSTKTQIIYLQNDAKKKKQTKTCLILSLPSFDADFPFPEKYPFLLYLCQSL